MACPQINSPLTIDLSGGRSCKKLQGVSLVSNYAAQDAPGNAQAGVEGANRRFATGTPNPPLPKSGIGNLYRFFYVYVVSEIYGKTAFIRILMNT
jgi:hypothetical protein